MTITTTDIKKRRRYYRDTDWQGVCVRDNGHKRWNQITGGDVSILEMVGHSRNKTASFEISEHWETESGRAMTRTIHMQLDETATRAIYDRLKIILGEE